MDPLNILSTYRIQHSHRNGGWGEMVEDRSHHDPADHDPERGWRDGRLFRCSSCDEAVMIVPEPPDAAPSDR